MLQFHRFRQYNHKTWCMLFQLKVQNKERYNDVSKGAWVMNTHNREIFSDFKEHYNEVFRETWLIDTYHREIFQEKVCKVFECWWLDHLQHILTERITILLPKSYTIINYNQCYIQKLQNVPYIVIYQQKCTQDQKNYQNIIQFR